MDDDPPRDYAAPVADHDDRFGESEEEPMVFRSDYIPPYDSESSDEFLGQVEAGAVVEQKMGEAVMLIGEESCEEDDDAHLEKLKKEKKVLIPGSRRKDGTYRKNRYKKITYKNADDLAKLKYIPKAQLEEKMREFGYPGKVSREKAEKLARRALNPGAYGAVPGDHQTPTARKGKQVSKLTKHARKVNLKNREEKKKLFTNMQTIKMRLADYIKSPPERYREAVEKGFQNAKARKDFIKKTTSRLRELAINDEMQFRELVNKVNQPFVICWQTETIGRDESFADYLFAPLVADLGLTHLLPGDGKSAGGPGTSAGPGKPVNLKKINKKLRQIAVIEQRVLNGQPINEDQKKKLATKDALLETLRENGVAPPGTCAEGEGQPGAMAQPGAAPGHQPGEMRAPQPGQPGAPVGPGPYTCPQVYHGEGKWDGPG